MKSAGLVSIIQKKYTPYKQSKELVLERKMFYISPDKFSSEKIFNWTIGCLDR